MTAPAPRPTGRMTIETRRILLTLPDTAPRLAEQTGPNRITRSRVDTVLVQAIRDGKTGPWALQVVEANGEVLLDTGGPSGLTLRRDYHPDANDSHIYHHADMPGWLAELVHTELEAPDAGDDRAVTEAARVAENWAASGRDNPHRAVALLLIDRAESWAALPDSVAGSAAPAGTTLAGRIRALVGERDHERGEHQYCHARHIGLEPVARELVDAIEADPDRAAGQLDDETRAVAAVLATRPRPTEDGPALVIRWDDDEHVTVLLGAMVIAKISHEGQGWDGMRAAINTTMTLADALDTPTAIEGVPNL